jgi:hypothetical protein
LENYWLRRVDGALGAPEAIHAALRDEVEVTLLEAVASVLLFRKSKDSWSASARDQALSPEALTTVSMQRLRFDTAISKRVKALKLVSNEDR